MDKPAKHPGMTEDEFGVLWEYIRDVADTLGLRRWWLGLSPELPGDCNDSEAVCLAEIDCSYAQQRAVIRVEIGFRHANAANQRHAIVHELLHCYLAACRDVIRVDLHATRALGQTAYDLLFQTFNHALESGVDGIATAIGGSFPLIDWPVKSALVRGEVEE